MKISTKILVLGGGGYVGSSIVNELLKNNFEVRCFDRFSNEDILLKFKKYKNLEIIVGDIRNIKEDVFYNIDIVIDLVSITKNITKNENELIETNKIARKKIIKIAEKNFVSQYIRISSSNVYAGTLKQDHKEKKLKPKNEYAKINLELDKFAISQNKKSFSVTVLRLASIFGYSIRMRWDQSINNMIYESYNNKKILVKSKSSKRPFLHIKDAISAIMLVIKCKDKTAGEIFNVGSNEQNFSMMEIAKKIIEISNYGEAILHDEKDENSFVMNCDKITKILGFKKKYDLEYGIKEILSKLKQDKPNF